MPEIAKTLARSVETPSPLERAGERLPVNIISGFLGSGKTTAIIKLLKQKAEDEKWAVIINEFGKISIDGQTLQSKSDAGTIFDISGGCICCTARIYFHENLENIINAGIYNRIIVEPTGLGGIDMVSEIVKTKPMLELMPIICLVDISIIENPRLQASFLYKAQISKADHIVFSKCDLVPDPEIQANLIQKFVQLFPEKAHCLAGSSFNTDLLCSSSTEAGSDANTLFFNASNSMLTDADYCELNFRFEPDKVFDSGKLVAIFSKYPSIIRSKGHLHTKQGWILFNFALSGYSFETCEAKLQNEIIFIAEKSDSSLKNLEEEVIKLVAE